MPEHPTHVDDTGTHDVNDCCVGLHGRRHLRSARAMGKSLRVSFLPNIYLHLARSIPVGLRLLFVLLEYVRDVWCLAVGILGATVVPHSLFLGSALATQNRLSSAHKPRRPLSSSSEISKSSSEVTSFRRENDSSKHISITERWISCSASSALSF
jgi:Mn2+/Fe2+ NRAMP family transporter